jgi:MoxR-like ATPase
VLEIIQAHLPEEPNSLIGREHERDELRRLIHSTRALTLCGPGGIGKTRLARRLLASMAAEFPRRLIKTGLADPVLAHQRQPLPQGLVLAGKGIAVAGLAVRRLEA